MRIGFACKADTANGRYRVIIPATEMVRRGHSAVAYNSRDTESLATRTPPWDLLHMHQIVGDDTIAIVERLKQHGIAVVWDCDDDIRSAPRMRETRRRVGGRRKLKRVHDEAVAMARAAHLMTTTNEHLAQIYRDAGVEHIAVIGNHLEQAWLPGRPRRHQGVVVGIVASIEHAPDVEQLRIAETLRRIQAEHDHVSVVAFGVDLKLRERYSHLPRVPFDQLLDRTRDFDIGLAPLVDSPFNRARSDVKLKEYAVAGVPWLASPVGPYRSFGEAQGGQLVDADGWHAAIDALVRDPHRRSQLTARGTAWARTQTIRSAGNAWERAFRGAVGRAKRI